MAKGYRVGDVHPTCERAKPQKRKTVKKLVARPVTSPNQQRERDNGQR